jgi:hypothetical protein
MSSDREKRADKERVEIYQRQDAILELEKRRDEKQDPLIQKQLDREILKQKVDLALFTASHTAWMYGYPEGATEALKKTVETRLQLSQLYELLKQELGEEGVLRVLLKAVAQ